MRIDLLLKTLCLVKTRSQGRAGCEAGAVLINGVPAKPSRSVRVGDVVEIRRAGEPLVIEIIDMPRRPPARKDAPAFYRVVGGPRGRDAETGNGHRPA